MIGLSLQTLAQISVERILNALPEGFLIAIFAWALLRVLRRQNSGTRFAIWFMALLTVAALPLLGVFGEGHSQVASRMAGIFSHPAISISPRWALFTFIMWSLGAFVATLRLAFAFWRLRALRNTCTPIVLANLDPAVRETLDAIAANSVEIATSESVTVPAAVGFWKRTIILPVWTLQELSPEDLNVILLHEFAHLRRGDDWTNLIQKIVRALFFFHPAVWWIENRLSVEREMACDDAVLAETANPQSYATCLVSLLEKSLAHRAIDRTSDRTSDQPVSMAQAAVHRAQEAALRLAQILDTKRPAATRIWKPALGMLASFSVVCLALLPQAPELVAVDSAASTYSTTQSNLSSQFSPGAPHAGVANAGVANAGVPRSLRFVQGAGVSITPTALRIDESSAARPVAKAASVRVIPVRSIARRHSAPKGVAAQPNQESPTEQLVAASLTENQEVLPQVQTLVFVEATQYADSPVWRVQVWRMTLITAVRERAARVPVASKT